MLTRFIRRQLYLFIIVGIIGIISMIVFYMQLPTLLGIGRMTVTLELPRTGGLYKFSNVTYRGVQIGKVTNVRATLDGAVATLSLSESPKIPADLTASVLSVSAVGEQYVDLLPHNDSGPYLQDGSVIPVANTTVPQQVGPMLDQAAALINSIPKEKLNRLLNEGFKGLNGASDEMSSLVDSLSVVAGDLDKVGDRARVMVDDLAPLLEAQASASDSLRTWTRSLAGVTAQLNTNDPQVRELLQNGPGALNEASQLLSQVKPTLPVLLANLTTLGHIAVTYRPSIEQLLVLLPPYIGSVQAVGLPRNNPTGFTQGDFTLTVGDPPACTVGFLPPSSWRSPDDLTDIDTPDGLYCKLPQDSPVGVRGARNYPCMNNPAKRAPTVELCESDQNYEPLAMRQHALGPNPIDPSLISQGIPPDDRVTLNDNIYGPLEGTPPPPGPAAAAPPPAPNGGQVAPSAYTPGASGPSVAIATYDPQTGQFAAPDGAVARQTDVVSAGGQRVWSDLLPTG